MSTFGILLLAGGWSRQNPAESALVQRVAAAPLFVPARLELADFYYRERRFSEASAALHRADEALAEHQRARERGQFRAGAQVPPPTKITDARPNYPAAASARGVVGSVLLDLLIDIAGRVVTFPPR